MAKNIHELKRNLATYEARREMWHTALSDGDAPFALRNAVFAHVRELDRRIQNLRWQISNETENKDNRVVEYETSKLANQSTGHNAKTI